MANLTALRGLCPEPFFQDVSFTDGGYIDGRLCQPYPPGAKETISCCLPCPMTDWTYPDNFNQLTSVASWINVVGMICCLFLLISWICLPVEKTHRHYLSISLTCAVTLMNLGFIVPLAARPDQCFDEITPNGMASSSVCAVSGSFLLIGGWGGVMWIFLRALSLHLQICWQMVVGRNFMWLSQAFGWGIPVVGLVVLLVFSGVSFRFGQTCHINHTNSLADFWIPLLVFTGLTVIIQFATFGYCIKVYLASLADNAASTEGSGLAAYSSSIRTMSPRQAYRRVRRVIALQWRGIVIVLIICADVVFFAITFVFLDNTVQAVKNDPDNSDVKTWAECLVLTGGNKNACLKYANNLVVRLPTVIAVLILLAMNGLWLVLLLGRSSMVTGWKDFFVEMAGNRGKKEFVSVDARMDLKKDPRSYEIAVKSPMSPRSGRQTPDYFGPQATRYQPHSRSFSSPRPPQQVSWEAQSPSPYEPPVPAMYTRGDAEYHSMNNQRVHDTEHGMNPLGMNKI